MRSCWRENSHAWTEPIKIIAAALLILGMALLLSACHSSDSGPPPTDSVPPPTDAGPIQDTEPPTLVSTRPLADAQGVATNAGVVLTFSEPMAIAATEAALAVTCQDAEGTPQPVSGAVSWSGDLRVLTFRPTGGWPAETQCAVRVGTGATDVAGNPLRAEVLLAFGTGMLPDVIAPRVTSVSPQDGASNQAVNLPVVLSFSEPMDAAATEAAFALSVSGAGVSGSFSWSNGNRVLQFQPGAPLTAASTCAVQLGTGALDLAGNALVSAFASGFATGEGTASTVEISPGITGLDRDGDGTVDEYALDLTQLTPGDLQDVLDDPDFAGTVVLNADPPVEFEVPLFLNRSGVAVQVMPPGAVTLDGTGTIETIVHVGGNGVSVDGLAVTGGLADLIAQSVDSEGNVIPISGLVLRNLIVSGSQTDDCIQLKDCTDCVIEHAQVYNCYAHGISTTGCTNITVRDSVIGCQDEPDCLYGALSNTGFLHFFRTDTVRVERVEIFASYRRSGGTGGAFAVKVEQNSGDITLEGLRVHGAFLPTPEAPFENVGAADAVIGVVQHETAYPAAQVRILDATLSGNNAPALYFEQKAGVASRVVVQGLSSSGHTGLVSTDGVQDCVIAESAIAETGVTSTAPCSDGGGNTFSP